MIKQVSLHSEGRFKKLYLLNFAQSHRKPSFWRTLPRKLCFFQIARGRASSPYSNLRFSNKLKLASLKQLAASCSNIGFKNHNISSSFVKLNIFMKLFEEYFIKYLEIIHKKMQKMMFFIIFLNFFMIFRGYIPGRFGQEIAKLSLKIDDFHHFWLKIAQISLKYA